MAVGFGVGEVVGFDVVVVVVVVGTRDDVVLVGAAEVVVVLGAAEDVEVGAVLGAGPPCSSDAAHPPVKVSSKSAQAATTLLLRGTDCSA